MESDRSPFHALAWLTWAVAAVTCVELAPNPFYVGVVLLAAIAVVRVHGARGPYCQAFRVLVTIGVIFAGLRIVLTALTTHGVGTVWFTTPAFTLPDALGGFTVGGAIEFTVIAQACVEGLAIVTIMAVFGAFNACASHHEILERTPRAFHELGLILTIGLAFIPSTLRAVHDVRLADRARTGGATVRRGRLIRTIVPVLATGLERALALAESMDARGFALQPPTRSERVAGILTFVGAVGLGGAVIALIGSATGIAAACALSGAAALIGAILLASRSSSRTRHRPRHLSVADACIMVAALLAPITLGIAELLGDTTHAWATSPLLWPHIAALPLIALSLLFVPLIPIGWRLPASARPRLAGTP